MTKTDQVDRIYEQLKADPDTKETKETIRR